MSTITPTQLLNALQSAGIVFEDNGFVGNGFKEHVDLRSNIEAAAAKLTADLAAHPSQGVVDEAFIAKLGEEAYRVHSATRVGPYPNDSHAPKWQAVVRMVIAALEAQAAAQPAVPSFDMLAHLQRQREWSGRTFGPGPRTAGVIDHIRKELREIEADPTDLSEWIDVVILALDGAWRAGGTPEQIIATLIAKQTKNEGRTWPDWRTAAPDKAIEHDRSQDALDGYYLASFKHGRNDGTVMWWMPNNAGYSHDLEQAGIYHEITPGYHDSEHTVPVPVAFINRLRVRRTVDYGDSLNTAFHNAKSLRAILAAATGQGEG